MSQTMSSTDFMVLSTEEHEDHRQLTTMPAYIIASDTEAISVATELAKRFAPCAAQRDQDRKIPPALIEEFSSSGLWAITIPREFGGADVSHVTLTRVFDIIAEADPSLAQIPQNHFTDVDTIRWTADSRQKRFFFSEVLFGARFGNAFAEAKNTNATKFDTTLRTIGGQLHLNGQKVYCTGALLADWVQVGAVDENGRNVLAFVRRNTPGLTIVDDWSGFGQRTTASGSVLLRNVVVEPQHVVHSYLAFDHPTTNGSLSQLLHAAIDLGIARAAINETIHFIRTSARPWVDANVEQASDDPFTIAEVGNIEYRLHAAEAMLERAGTTMDVASSEPTEYAVASASIAVAEAKIATTEVALLATNTLFELAGAKATLSKFALDRHWRNARTHTLHDPVRWKYHVVGDYYLNNNQPQRRGWI